MKHIKNIKRLQHLLEKSEVLPILQLRMNLRVATGLDFPLGTVVICNDGTKISLFDRQVMYKKKVQLLQQLIQFIIWILGSMQMFYLF